MKQASSPDEANVRALARRHLQFAWWSLLCFLSLGILLEALHGLKIDWYLKTSFQTRRLMWTLGHAHGTILALVHAAFATWVQVFLSDVTRLHRWASCCLMGASLLLPGGFFLGGVFLYAGDPGLGVFLVPVGGSLLFVGVLLTALGTSRGAEVELQPETPDVAARRRSSVKRR
jgi:hypothetical protein